MPEDEEDNVQGEGMERKAALVEYVKMQHQIKQQSLQAGQVFMQLLSSELCLLAEELQAAGVPDLEIAQDTQNKQAIPIHFCDRDVLVELVDVAAQANPDFRLLVADNDPVAKINVFYLSGNQYDDVVTIEQIYVTAQHGWMAQGVSGIHENTLSADTLRPYAFCLLEGIVMRLQPLHWGKKAAKPLADIQKPKLGFKLLD
ncbi:MAG: hypothetical protein JXA33_24960 [Anaerolineae bacterium]|nr:hypothetical protein [Anaerolineae bacterium]